MKRPKNLTTKFKITDPEIVTYIKALEKENLRLQKKIGPLQAKNVSQQHEITVLKKFQPEDHGLTLNINIPSTEEQA